MPEIPLAAALGAIVAVLVVAAAVEAIAGTLRIRRLLDEEPPRADALPTLSVVVAARNESEHIAHALQSVLAQDYPGLEVIAVDDRSDDGTGRTLDRLAASAPRLRVLHVTDLPEGWLGKNHALHAGAKEATGRYILFTDADVVYEPGVLARALGAVVRRRLDHMTVSPEIVSPSRLVRVFVAGFALFFSLYTRPWFVPNQRSRASVGIGAFNLVRAERYRAAGGHAPIRMRPDDDLMLGRLMKRRGARSELCFGAGAISVAWYPSLGALVRGLMKNAYAGVGYRLAGTASSVAGLLVFGIGPLLVAATSHGAVQALGVMATVFLLAAAAVAARSTGQPPWFALAVPVSALVFAWILVRATALTLYRGGIEWRGTFYPLAALRENRLTREGSGPRPRV